MSRRVHDQPDLFGDAPPEPDLFAGAEPPRQARRVDHDTIRRRLEHILAAARAAEKMPWDSAGQELYRSLFPEMAALLPEEEAAQYCLRFEQEWTRLTAANRNPPTTHAAVVGPESRSMNPVRFCRSCRERCRSCSSRPRAANATSAAP